MGSCAAPSAKGDDKFITTDYLQQCLIFPDFYAKNHHMIKCHISYCILQMILVIIIILINDLFDL
ncbi:hypothetical protein DIM20_11775 [Salmonella enterica]|nr:hypothetical protein [Salmonella enterica]